MRTKELETPATNTCDIISNLARMDLTHIIERIFMYLGSDSLLSLKDVSDDWTRIVYSSRFLYKTKVLFYFVVEKLYHDCLLRSDVFWSG